MGKSAVKPQDPSVLLRSFFLLDGLIRIFIWYSSIGLTFVLFNWLAVWPTGSPIGGDLGTVWTWAERIAHWVMAYNVIYLLHLLILRLLIPTIKEGRYDFAGKGGIQLHLVWASLVAVLIRARYEAPFPGFLVYHIANLPPFCWLVNRILGPKSRSVFVLDPPMPDPDFTEIGRNVTIGWGTSLTAHIHDREGVTIKKIVVEDDVMIGAEVLIYGGVTIKRGAIVFGGAVVPPFTVIGENEAWGGVPARKIKDMPPLTSEVGDGQA